MSHILLITMFTQLRDRGFDLGIAELLDAVRLLDAEADSADKSGLQDALRLLWCRSPDEQRQFTITWDDTLNAPPAERQRASDAAAGSATAAAEPFDESLFSASPGTMPAAPSPASPDWSAFPVYAPFTPAPSEHRMPLHSFWPISRRAMRYGWRALRRPVADGPEDVLDMNATVAQVARYGFFLSPVRRRREQNHAHLLLLIDQGGSMTPLHHFCRDLLSTARPELSGIQQVDAAFFHNVPGDYLYENPHLTAPVSRERVFGHCDTDTSVLIVSDAGAARGLRRLPRIQATTEALAHLRQRTALIAWLNPMPRERWMGSSAQIIARLVPMFQMDSPGFTNAIDVLRGQPLLKRPLH